VWVWLCGGVCGRHVTSRDLTGHASTDIYVETNDECKRLSVWCVSLMATIARLAREAEMDADMQALLRAAVPPLLDLQKVCECGCVGVRIGVVWCECVRA
jgi:hypothetical protein